MKFVTVATKNEGYYEILLESCKKNDIDLVVLGWGETFGGWVWRLNLINEYYKSLDPNEIVCFIDAYDVIILQSKSEIEKRFKRANCRILISEDYNTNQYQEFKARKRFGTCESRRINAGTYIGYVSDIMWMLESICILNDCENNTSLDDQVMITKLCTLTPDRMKIDIEKEIFLTICYRKSLKNVDIYIDNQKVLHYKKQYIPCILHGPAKTNLDEVVELLGYSSQTNKL